MDVYYCAEHFRDPRIQPIRRTFTAGGTCHCKVSSQSNISNPHFTNAKPEPKSTRHVTKYVKTGNMLTDPSLIEYLFYDIVHQQLFSGFCFITEDAFL